MSKQDNIDELGAILDDFAESIKEIQAERQNDVYYDRNGASADIDEAFATATQAIEDFYRNKILEARNETLDALENHKKTLNYIVKDGAPRNPTNYEVYMRKAIEVDAKIAQLTAQSQSTKQER